MHPALIGSRTGGPGGMVKLCAWGQVQTLTWRNLLAQKSDLLFD